MPEGEERLEVRTPHSTSVISLYSASTESFCVLEPMMSVVVVVGSSVLTQRIRPAPVSAMYRIPFALSSTMWPGTPALRVGVISV